MLFVRFTDVPHQSIPNYERLPFKEALLLSAQLQEEMHGSGEHFTGEFRIFDDTDQLLYKGVFQFGGPHPTLYHQLKDRIPRIRARKEDATKKILLLERLEQLTPDSYKTMNPVPIVALPNEAYVSRLSRGQRRTVYGVTGVSLLLLGIMSVVQTVSQNPSTPVAAQSQSEDWQSLYEDALNGDTTPLAERLEKKSKWTDEQKQFLITHYLSQRSYKKAVSITNDPVDVETVLMQSPLLSAERATILEAFQNAYPTDEGAFDLAIVKKDYKHAVAISDIELTPSRAEARTRAYISLQDATKAKDSLRSVQDEELRQQVDQLVRLDQEIKELEEEKRELSTKGDKEKVEELDELLKAKRRQASTILQ